MPTTQAIIALLFESFDLAAFNNLTLRTALPSPETRSSAEHEMNPGRPVKHAKAA